MYIHRQCSYHKKTVRCAPFFRIRKRRDLKTPLSVFVRSHSYLIVTQVRIYFKGKFRDFVTRYQKGSYYAKFGYKNLATLRG